MGGETNTIKRGGKVGQWVGALEGGRALETPYELCMHYSNRNFSYISVITPSELGDP